MPLENAYYGGFYNEMTGFIRSLFESALKTNLSLEFAVITGCLRISKESIFTGLNNLYINSVMSSGFDEYFGFTQQEVDAMLMDYGIAEQTDVVREWYDGYLFGKTKIYNPWSVINFIKSFEANEDALPVEYWSNTSSNSIVKDLIVTAKTNVKEKLESLICGETIEKMMSRKRLNTYSLY